MGDGIVGQLKREKKTTLLPVFWGEPFVIEKAFLSITSRDKEGNFLKAPVLF